MIWKRKSLSEINERIFTALNENVNYKNETIIGVPASHLDEQVFSQEVSFIRDAPFLSTLVQNPNHIGCHTMGKSENFFAGTQELETEVLAICAEEILHAQPDMYDGYVASGGTEANLQAIWIYRNYFLRTKNARLNEIALIFSEDSHYSMVKAANMFCLKMVRIPVNPDTRQIEEEVLSNTLENCKQNGVKYAIVVANMMTTMFGSVDDAALYSKALRGNGLEFCIHVDGAYGGFYYPIVHEETSLTFKNPDITSFTLDAHKMVQAPYGTGIFLIRKGWMHFAATPEASYVEGEDSTICGSRSGANAVAVWLIFAKYGKHGWFEKMSVLQKRADWLENQLKQLDIGYFRNPYSNILTLRAEGVPLEVAQKFGLVPDNHHAPSWYKIVIMDHVTIEKLEAFTEAVKPVLS